MAKVWAWMHPRNFHLIGIVLPGATMAWGLEGQRWTFSCPVKRSKAARSWIKGQDEMKREGRLCWYERQKWWHSEEDNIWTNFHSSVSRKTWFWHVLFFFWYSIPCQPKWVFSRHDDSNPLREESYASMYLISCSMARGQGKQQRRCDEVLHEVDEKVSA